jgi:hypothetical protein
LRWVVIGVSFKVLVGIGHYNSWWMIRRIRENTFLNIVIVRVLYPAILFITGTSIQETDASDGDRTDEPHTKVNVACSIHNIYAISK